MKPEIKAKWLEALRSGEYKQGGGALCANASDGMEYCCLGVLTDIYAKEKGIAFYPTKNVDNEWDAPLRDTLDVSSRPKELLCNEVIEWAGLDCDNPLVVATVYTETCNYTVADLNDEHHLTFNEIADAIEASL